MRVLVTGASGFMGGAFLQAFGDHDVRGIYRTNPRPGLTQLDLRDAAAVRELFDRDPPQTVIHCAAKPTVDWCELNAEKARQINLVPTAALAAECARVGATLVFLSSDYVFDGRAGPYAEDAATNPINVYGRLKLQTEEAIRDSGVRHLIVRTTNVYGYDALSKNFLMGILPQLARGEPIRVAQDQFGTPTLVDDMCSVARELVLGGQTGLIHVVGPDMVDRLEWAQAAARVFGIDPALVSGVPTDALSQPAPRPRRSGLMSIRLSPALTARLRPLAAGLVEMRRQRDASGATSW